MIRFEPINENPKKQYVDKVLTKVKCSHPGCDEVGMAYVNPKATDVLPHFCIKHNPMIVRSKK